MRYQFKILIGLFAIMILAICGHVIFYFNYLTDLRYNVVTEKSKISSAIQYRNNLMPVLIESVSNFVEHEDNVFNRTVDARERVLSINKQSLPEPGAARKPGNSIQDVIQRIMAIGEQYPNLVTSEAFQLLMKQVADAESKIFELRTNYNDAVNIYTTAMSMFPGNVYASVFDFPKFEYFLESQGSEWPKVTTKYQISDGGADGS